MPPLVPPSSAAPQWSPLHDRNSQASLNRVDGFRSQPNNGVEEGRSKYPYTRSDSVLTEYPDTLPHSSVHEGRRGIYGRPYLADESGRGRNESGQGNASFPSLPHRSLRSLSLELPGPEYYVSFYRATNDLLSELARLQFALKSIGSCGPGVLAAKETFRAFERLQLLYGYNTYSLFPRPRDRRFKHLQPEGDSYLPQFSRTFGAVRDALKLLECALGDLQSAYYDYSSMYLLACLQKRFKREAKRASTTTGVYSLPFDELKIKIQSLLDDFVTDAVERLRDALDKYCEKGIPLISQAQKGKTAHYLNLTTIATLLSAVTASLLQLSVTHTDGSLDIGVNTSLFSSLSFSIASAINSLLAVSWQKSVVRTPEIYLPSLVRICLISGPMISLVISVILSAVALCLFVFSSGQHIITSTSTVSFAVLNTACLMLLSAWMLSEKWKFGHCVNGDVTSTPIVEWRAFWPEKWKLALGSSYLPCGGGGAYSRASTYRSNLPLPGDVWCTLGLAYANSSSFLGDASVCHLCGSQASIPHRPPRTTEYGQYSSVGDSTGESMIGQAEHGINLPPDFAATPDPHTAMPTHVPANAGDRLQARDYIHHHEPAATDTFEMVPLARHNEGESERARGYRQIHGDGDATLPTMHRSVGRTVVHARDADRIAVPPNLPDHLAYVSNRSGTLSSLRDRDTTSTRNYCNWDRRFRAPARRTSTLTLEEGHFVPSHSLSRRSHSNAPRRSSSGSDYVGSTQPALTRLRLARSTPALSMAVREQNTSLLFVGRLVSEPEHLELDSFRQRQSEAFTSGMTVSRQDASQRVRRRTSSSSNSSITSRSGGRVEMRRRASIGLESPVVLEPESALGLSQWGRVDEDGFLSARDDPAPNSPGKLSTISEGSGTALLDDSMSREDNIRDRPSSP